MTLEQLKQLAEAYAEAYVDYEMHSDMKTAKNKAGILKGMRKTFEVLGLELTVDNEYSVGCVAVRLAQGSLGGGCIKYY